MKDYYAILGVVPSAEDVVIRAAWKALAQRYHPDRFSGGKAEANARMAEINEAYNLLSDPEKRKFYDEARGKKEGNFSDWEHEEDVNQDANAYDPLENNWELAISFYPDLYQINLRLGKISKLLAFTYRASLLETKEFEKKKELAEIAEQLFLESYFGSNKEIVNFARMVINSGKKEAARALNKAVVVLGSKVPSERIINKICVDFGFETIEMREERERQEKLRMVEAMKKDNLNKVKVNALKEKFSLGFPLGASDIVFLKSMGEEQLLSSIGVTP